MLRYLEIFRLDFYKVKWKWSSVSCRIFDIISTQKSTCILAIDKASSKFPVLMSLQNFFDPATLHLSPILTKLVFLPIFIGSSPDRSISSIFRSELGCLGGIVLTASATALICFGVVPQQPENNQKLRWFVLKNLVKSQTSNYIHQSCLSKFF